MNKVAAIWTVFLLAGATGAPAANAQTAAFDELKGVSAAPVEQLPEPQAESQPQTLTQFLPDNNSAPGFNWPINKGTDGGDYIQIGNSPTYLKVSDAQSENLQEGSGKCALSPKTKYSISGFPGFEGENIKVTLKDPLPGCSFTQGYVFMAHVDATSAGGASELPAAVRAFLDTLAFSEGTTDHYNYIFSFATFKSYADHPRQKKCIGRLCSDAAGRYQFLSDTWDPMASALGLKDFTPPSQDKAVIELIRRDGTYSYVAGSAVYKNFTKAVYRLNNIWASLPGSPYGQPTHSMASLWSYYKVALAKYK